MDFNNGVSGFFSSLWKTVTTIFESNEIKKVEWDLGKYVNEYVEPLIDKIEEYTNKQISNYKNDTKELKTNTNNSFDKVIELIEKMMEKAEILRNEAVKIAKNKEELNKNLSELNNRKLLLSNLQDNINLILN